MMAETTNGPLQQNQVLLQSLFHALDPISLILAQNSNLENPPVPLRLTTESYFMERGPRYNEYAELRESKLRKKNMRQQQMKEEEYENYENCEISEPKQSPLKKQVRFQGNFTNSKKGSSASSVLAQSVPDFSATLRKENRKPPASSRLELTPPTKNWSKSNVGLSNSRGSKSANAGERKGVMARKSYASIEELKGLSMGVAKDICGDNRGRNGRGGGVAKSILGYRQF